MFKHRVFYFEILINMKLNFPWLKKKKKKKKNKNIILRKIFK
jgi:hypothetical protein